VEYERLNEEGYVNIWLCGPAEKVFEGQLELPEQ
jgi:diaminopimelate epimerase